jgi:inorganic pyrophosphatase
MPKYDELPSRCSEDTIRVVVESPRGSRVKIGYDPELEVFAIDRELVLGLAYPYDWGFVPSTLAQDGDPLDAMVLGDSHTYPGVVLAGRAIGVARVTEPAKKGRIANDRVLFAPADEERYAEMTDVRALSKRARQELERFFLSATLFDKRDVRLEGWDGPKAALKLVASCEAAWAERRTGK